MKPGIDDISFEYFLNSISRKELIWHTKAFFDADYAREIIMEQYWNYKDFLLNLTGEDPGENISAFREQLIEVLDETDVKSIIGLMANLTQSELIIKHLLKSISQAARKDFLYNSWSKKK